MKFKIITDSSANIMSMEEVAFASVPISIYAGDKVYVDNQALDPVEMTEELLAYKGKTSTACPSVEDWMAEFEGYDEIYVVTLTGTMSGTYNSAVLAKDIYQEEHAEVKIEIVDSLSTGPEMHLLLDQILEWKKAGKTFEEVCEWIKEYKTHTRLFFSLASVHNLVENGRLNRLVGAAIGKLGICLVGTASEKGELEVLSKCRGEKKTLLSYLEHIEKAGYKGGKIYISHVSNEALAMALKAALIEKYGEVPIEIYPTRGLCSYYAEKQGMLVGVEC